MAEPAPAMAHDDATTPPGGPAPKARVIAYRRRATCPECGAAFVARNAQQGFCCTAHQTRFQDRNSRRGRGGLVQLALAWRAGRNRRGKSPADVEARAVSTRAFQELCMMLDAHAREDRPAGRDPIAYLRQRWKSEGTL